MLNYAYALEQLEAAFYFAVLAHAYAGITTQEMRALTDVRDHEIAHRDFLPSRIRRPGDQRRGAGFQRRGFRKPHEPFIV